MPGYANSVSLETDAAASVSVHLSSFRPKARVRARVPLETIRLAQKGGAEAFAELYLAFAGRVRSYIFGLVRHDEDAAEATQQTFLQAFRALPGLRRPELFPAWLLAIARNEALAVLRRRNGGIHTPLEENPELQQMRVDCDPTALQALSDVCRRLPRFKQEIVAGMAAGLTEQEIAEQIHRTPASVKMHKHRLRKYLREVLG